MNHSPALKETGETAVQIEAELKVKLAAAERRKPKASQKSKGCPLSCFAGREVIFRNFLILPTTTFSVWEY